MSISSPPLDTPSLPSPEKQPFTHVPLLLSAYNLTVTAEIYAIDLCKVGPSSPNSETNVICARIVGFFLIYLYSNRTILSNVPCLELSRQVISPGWSAEDANNVVYKLGAMYRDHLIRGFRVTGKPYDSPSTHVSQPSFDTLEDMIMDTMEASGTNYSTARKKALARDGYRCMISQALDYNSCAKTIELDKIADSDPHGISIVETCHIINELAMKDIGPVELPHGTNKSCFSAGLMAILKTFRLGYIVDTLTEAGGIHRLENLLSLSSVLHRYFDDLNLWFEPAAKPNCYTVHIAQEYYKRGLSYFEEKPQFKVHSSKYKNIPLPDSKLLTLHGVCARVAHMSGAATFLDDLDRNVEETLVLAEDGSSAQMLQDILAPYSDMSITA